MNDIPEPQAIQILDDLLNGGPAPSSPVAAPPLPPVASQPATSIMAAQANQIPQPANAGQQAVPGISPPAGGSKGPQAVAIPTVVSRANVSGTSPTTSTCVDLTPQGSFEENFAKLLIKDLELAQHDRSMAIALLQTHLDRAEVLDQMQLSMPVATVISDNTGATLKSLELAMKAGERVHKAAELLVAAQKNNDAAALNALKLKGNGGDNWGGDLPE